jgi:hypothetical protein
MGIMSISSGWCPVTCLRIHVLAAELLATLEAPGSAATVPDLEGLIRGQSTSKNIIAGGVFQAPPFAPGTLFGIVAHGTYC